MWDGDGNPVPSLNGAGTGYRSRQAAAYPGQLCPLSAGYPAYRMANSPHSGHARIVSIRSKNSAGHGRVRIGRFRACQHGTSEGHLVKGRA